jgi:hypothetical protein
VISFSAKATDRPVLAVLPSASGMGIGWSSLALPPVHERTERPTQARTAVVAAPAYAFAAANGAGNTHTQHTWMGAFRGLEPWSDPI